MSLTNSVIIIKVLFGSSRFFNTALINVDTFEKCKKKRQYAKSARMKTP